MTKYIKKPVVIEAVIWDGTNGLEMQRFMGIGEGNYYFQNGNHLHIKTSEGDMKANVGDFIIKEPFDKKRKFYPCKPDIFDKTYELEAYSQRADMPSEGEQLTMDFAIHYFKIRQELGSKLVTKSIKAYYNEWLKSNKK